MARKRYTAEQTITKLREAEVEVGNGEATPQGGKELGARPRNLSGVRVDLERQVSTSGQVSSLLNNMATVFSDEKALPGDPQRVKSSKDV